MVRRVGTEPDSGRLRWAERSFLYGNFAECELGYAVTDHVAQSRTVAIALVLITGTEDRQHAYVATPRQDFANPDDYPTRGPALQRLASRSRI